MPRRAEALDRSLSGSFPAPVPEEGGGGINGNENGGGSGSGGRTRTISGTSLKGVKEEDDEDRVDAKNAASRLATSTF